MNVPELGRSSTALPAPLATRSRLQAAAAYLSTRCGCTPSGEPVHVFAVDNMLRNGPDPAAYQFPQAGILAEPIGCQITYSGCPTVALPAEKGNQDWFSGDLPICDPPALISQAAATV